jgi:hypothetical protein
MAKIRITYPVRVGEKNWLPGELAVNLPAEIEEMILMNDWGWLEKETPPDVNPSTNGTPKKSGKGKAE